MFDAAILNADQLTADLATQGYAIRRLLEPETCRTLAGL